jgi:hypothetical protein
MERCLASRLVALVALLLALIGPASAAETWILWEKKEGQTTGEFNDTWTPVGSYEGERGCRAMRREIVARYRRKDVSAVDADTVRIQDPLGWWLTYTCRPGGAPPR